MEQQPLRTVLYMPGSNARAIEKARSLDCDGVILDLEDAVAPEAKEEARSLVTQALNEGGFGHRFMILRVNAADTAWHAEDMKLAASVKADAVLIPKINREQDVYDARAKLADTPLWAMMETPLAMLNAQSIAAAGLQGFVMGTNDLSKDTGARLIPGRAPMLAWLSTCIAAARAYGLTILDGVFNAIDDPEGFLAECEQGRDLGMDGKTVIHPKQLDPCNTIFAPDAEDVAFAQKIIDAFAEPNNADKGALRIDGKMVERLHAEMAAKTVAMANAIAARAG
ncbi:MAG: CoA ester lyase [Rhizobiales bacterium]|nr:CoA ester lyase [Hyphomicrobiales bacterium]MBO6699825.1 CoA ester lyase [Hyphomicrobiales bacterium]MBO6737363.1 CoA ester lyase [Hyphomicrobiales bacterium]MBO6911563.1 CoA ester lyase [Hyphomicrobiales bacterium]MBO6955137.1 CoA ester lyase [Hyphomicrobiales bacterium]